MTDTEKVSDTGFDPDSSFDIASRVSGMHERARKEGLGIEWFLYFLADVRSGATAIEAAAHACREVDC